MHSIENYSLREKIGQMLMIGFRGTSLDATHHILKDIKNNNLGSVVLYDYDIPSNTPVRNIVSRKQLAALISSLKEAATIPLFIALDQEGGKIGRLKPAYGFVSSPTPKTLGNKSETEESRYWASQIASDLSKLQVNLNLAPVVDLEINPDCPSIGKHERSFSAKPEVVSKHSNIFIEEHHKQNVLCTLKHFPGHGSSSVNSHNGLTDITSSWKSSELLPYKKLISSGICDAIMVSHLVHKTFDQKYPATLSRKIVDGLLRGKMSWDGVVISDDLQMKAIVEYYGKDTAFEKAINAGIDILVLSNNSSVVAYNPNIVLEAIQSIERMVSNGSISLKRINESFRRILLLKERIGF